MKSPIIRALATAVPQTCYSQEEILNILRPYFSNNRHTDSIFMNAGIGSRYMTADQSFYQKERLTQERNEYYMEAALPLGALAIQRCLARAGMRAEEIDDFVVVSCTGLDIPGLDLRLAGRLNMAPGLRRTCILGMGCYAAFPGLLRAGQAALAKPGSTALVLALELCSLHFQPEDDSLENVVSSALFADGAAAVLVSTEPGAAAAGPALLDSASFCDYQSFDAMAFHLTNHGFSMRLSAYVPKILAANIEGFVDGLLERNGLSRADVSHWGVHPGGRKILDYVEERLGLAADALEPSRTVLHEYGNMSSATIVFVLDELQRQRHPAPGEYGLLLSFGPGLTIEGAVLRW